MASYELHHVRPANSKMYQDGERLLPTNPFADAPEVVTEYGPEVVQDHTTDKEAVHDWITAPQAALLSDAHDHLPSYYGDQSKSSLLRKEPQYDVLRHDGARRKRICGLSTKWFYTVLCIGVLIIIAIVIGVGVGVTRHDQKSSITAPLTISNTSKLASVSFQDAGGVTHCRVYYQDTQQRIKESAWNASSNTWAVSNEYIAVGKPGTPLAASMAMANDGSPTINLFFILPGDAISFLTNSVSSADAASSSSTWEHPSSLPASDSLRVDSDSYLAAAYTGRYGCSTCANTTVLAYQDSTNLTVASIDPLNGQWSFATLNATPVAGTQLSMFYFSPNQLRLWYENRAQELWFYQLNASTNGSADLWIDRGIHATNLTAHTPIVGFSYEASMSNWTQFYQVLYFQTPTSPYPYYSTPTIESAGWVEHGDGTSTWVDPYSPQGLNSLMYNETVFAANDARRVYILVNGLITEYEVDYTSQDAWTTWNVMGYVPTE